MLRERLTSDSRGDGEQGRDFTYIDNVVQANLQALKADATLAAGRVFYYVRGRHIHSTKRTVSLQPCLGLRIHLSMDLTGKGMCGTRLRISLGLARPWGIHRRLGLKRG